MIKLLFRDNITRESTHLYIRGERGEPMDGKAGPGENVSNCPHDMDELAKELDSMSVEDLKEEFKILVSEMDEDSSCGDLLELYLDTIARKDPQPQYVDAQTSYERFLERMKANGKKRRPRALLKVCIVAAVVAALMAASVAVAYAKGFDLFNRIAHWTAETFGLSSVGTPEKDGAEIPPQLQGMKEAMERGNIDINHLPTYWPEGYEQSQLVFSDDPESYTVLGTFGEKGNRIVLSYVQLLSGVPEDLYSIDEQQYEVYKHNGIQFHIMTNMGNYLAVWVSENVECHVSGLNSYEDLIKILDSIGG